MIMDKSNESQAMKRWMILLFMTLCVLCRPCGAQELSGYAGVMPSVVVQDNGETYWQGLIHNRLNFGWQFSEYFRIDAAARNRLITGSTAMVASSGAGADADWADLSWNWATDGNVVGNTALDRLYITFEKDKWKLQLGRQRINWGQTFVWNPNDLFNTYSFFDFDYPERAGSDAFRATWFHSATSSSEFAAGINRAGKATVALLHHRNFRNFDYQFILGEMAETDLVAGMAWSGDIKGVNFRGELSYFHPARNVADTSGVAAMSVGVDYIFSNSLMLQAEALYNSSVPASGDGLFALYSAPLSAKQLSVSKWNLFAQASYPFSPRLNGSLSGMWLPGLKAAYAGFTADFSLGNNLDLSAIAQYFASSGTGGMQVLLGFIRLKWSF